MRARLREKFASFYEAARDIFESRRFKIGILNLIAFTFAGVAVHYYMKHMQIQDYNACYTNHAPVRLDKNADGHVRMACAILSKKESLQHDRDFAFCVLRDTDRLPLMNKKSLDLYLKPCYQAVVSKVNN